MVAPPFAECISLAHVIDVAPDAQLFKSIHDGCFSGCRSLEDIQLPPSISSLGKRVFYNCTKLSSMDLSACHGLSRIQNQAFGFCSALKSCSLPAEVAVIGTSAFGQCYELRQFHLGGGMRRRQGGNASPAEAASQLATIGDEAFASCRSLKSMALPSSLQSIGNLAFANCFGLLTIELAPDIRLREVGNQIFLGCKRLVNIELPEAIAHSRLLKHGIFEGCTDLKERFAPIEGNSNETFLREALSIRYGASPLHRLCYYQTHYSVEESLSRFERILADSSELRSVHPLLLPTRWVDIFQTTPIHILVVSTEANPKLLQAILDQFTQHAAESMPQVACLLLTEDLSGRIPLQLVCLSDSPIKMLEVLLQAHSAFDFWELKPSHWKSCIDTAMYHRRELLPLLIRSNLATRVSCLGSKKCKQDMIHRIETIVTETVMASRRSIASIERTLEQYEKQETVAILRSTIWKAKMLELCEQRDSRIPPEERSHCWIQSGDEIVVANVLPFLGL